MSKRKFLYLISYCLTILVASCTNTSNNPIVYHDKEIKILEEDKITLQIGDTFTIKLYQNASIGGSNCWINESKCKSVNQQRKSYVSSLEVKQGCEGCGGSEFWTFKAIKVGIDTIKIKNCPTGRKQKNCSSFQEDSISYLEDIKYSSKYDRAIIISVDQ